MDNRVKDEFDACFRQLQRLTTESFTIMNDDPGKKDEIISLWKNHIARFVAHTYKTGEKFNNKDVFKTITKAIMYGR